MWNRELTQKEAARIAIEAMNRMSKFWKHYGPTLEALSERIR